MAEVLFYHLSESTLEMTLPNLIERSLGRDWRVVVQFMSEERRNAMDAQLWTYSDASFIAHGSAHDKFPAEQPVFLTLGDDNPNGAQIRFCVEGAVCADPETYTRLVMMFDGHDDSQLETARTQWKRLKESGHHVTYWQQNAEWRWEKKG